MQSRSCRFVLIYAVLVLSLVASSAALPEPQTQATDSQLAARIQRVENGIPPIPLGENEPPLQLNLQDLMKLYKVPGLSVAVIDNFKIAWAKGYGVTEAGMRNPVTVHTLFQAASISKPVTAMGSLYLVEHGKLSLDENVNARLKSWQLPDNDFTKDQKVTLRRLLSHSASLTVHGFPGYEVGKPIPTIVRILDGEPPANTAPVRVDAVPGTKFNYSGGGIVIEQLLITDVTGKPFPQFMRETVLDKIGMTDSTYEQPLPASRASSAATATHPDGASVPGKWHVYPEMAAAGLWTTPTDLAKFAIEVALSKHGKANHVLSQDMTAQMLTPQIPPVGLGPFLGDFKNPEEFGHTGSNEGFRSMLVAFADSGKGLAIMINSDNGQVAMPIVNSVAKEYGWNYTPQPESAGDVLMLIATARGPEAAISRYTAWKKMAPPPYAIDENTLINLGYHFLTPGQTETAIQVFKLEVQDYPKYWNTYDSLGEAYMKAGQKDLAIQNYEKSIELKPDNQSGIDMLKKLKQPN
jgi:CubicO group peptidase (beta-lactamase class C family)